MVAVIRLVLVTVLLCPAVAQATVYYVATTGSDANNGTSESTPKLTVQHCVSIMVAGDTCLVRGGTYVETSTIRFGVTGTQAAPIKLLAYPNESPVITWATQTSNDRILILNTAGDEVAMGWITISGFEIHHGYNGIKFHSVHNSTISHNWLHDHAQSAILGIGGHHDVITRNILNHNGPIATDPTSTLSHGIYLHGSDMTISNNLIYDNLGYGIQQNGSSSSVFNSAIHPSADFALAQRWIVVNNTIAYNINRAGIVVWGNDCDSSRYENNIIYENATTLSTGSLQGIDCVGCSGSTGIGIKNNHFYASGSGGQVGIDTTFNADLVSSGNVTNVSAPAFVNGGSNALPVSPDFRLTALAPVNIALANEFPTNGVVGAFQPLGAPTGTITTNKIRLTFNAATAVPTGNLSTTGATAACTLANCPGALTITNVNNVPNTDTQIEEVVSGFAGNACASTNLSVTSSYNAATGSWTGNDNIGPYPGLHQKILSFTNLALTNNCTGSGPAGYPAGYRLYIPFDEGTGVTANDSSANNLDCTLANGATWGAGKSGFGMVIAGNNTQNCGVSYGSGIDPSSNSLTVAVGVNIPAGQEGLNRSYVGVPLGSGQRGYISQNNGAFTIGIQNSNDGTAGNIAVTSGWHHLCLTFNSATDVATLYVDGVASSSAGAVKNYTSYTFSGNFELGRIAGQATGGAAGTYDDFLIYDSVQDCAALSAVFSAAATPPGGTLAQAAIQFQGVILDQAGNPIVIGPSVQTIEVPKRGGGVILFQVHCQNIADCELTPFKLVYSKNGSSLWHQVPDVETADGTWMWGASTEAHLNNGLRSTRLTGSCALTTGTTQMIAAQTTGVDLPQDGCVVLGYVVHVDGIAEQDYFDFKLRTESDLDFPGGYAQIARFKVVNPMAGGVGY